MPDFDKLWNYSNPAETEIKFREVLKDSSPEKNLSEHLQLLTQIARTYSLRGMFTEAHETLNEVEKQLSAVHDLAHARYHLECGRAFNSSGKKAEAKQHFETAKNIATEVSEDFFTIDAIHMLAIVAPPEVATALNEEGILFAENSNQESAKNWLGALYNNLGWAYFDKKEYEKALSIFLRALKWREEKQEPSSIFLAKWCVARTLRALNKTEEALKVQLALFEESVTTGQNDGYVHEELGELFLLKGENQKSSFHFEKAYELLSADKYLLQHEMERLERMKELSKP